MERHKGESGRGSAGTDGGRGRTRKERVPEEGGREERVWTVMLLTEKMIMFGFIPGEEGRRERRARRGRSRQSTSRKRRRRRQ